MLTPEQERTAINLFLEALEREENIPGGSRDWLSTSGAHETELIRRVLELLEADRELTEIEAVIDGAPLERPPDTVGPYQLEALIGAGGMGAVYRARRHDGLFDQTVAIKFMRARQHGFDLGPLIDAERRTLARMDHDAIARILDGGTTRNGLSYLVMEFVDGEPIDDHALRHAMTVKEIVALIRQVAGALAHAHQSRIVHCDVKPSNILVTASGRAKLIDFGIARLQEAVAETGLDAVTRAYASPERCRKEPATLADDVYSLAVTLYQLLAGTLPWEAQRADPGGAPLPLPPVTARNSGDLAAIIGKALSAAPEARYRSIDAFDADLARWEAAQPVSARPRTFSYLTQRFAQRRPAVLGAMLAATLATLGALGMISHLYLDAEAARQNADQRFSELRSLAAFMIFDLNTQLEQVPGATPARLAMTEQAQTYLDALGASAGDDTALQRDVATGLTRLAEVQGVPSRPNLGQSELAMANLERALALFDGLIRQNPEDAALRAARGRASYFLAVTKGAHDLDPAAQLSLAERAEPDVLHAIGAAGEEALPELESLLLGIQLTKSDAYQTIGDLEAALALREAGEARLLALPETVRTGMDFNFEAGRVAALLGDSLYYLDRIPASRDAYQRAAARFEAGLQTAPLNRRLLTGLHYAYYSLSAVHADLGDAASGLAAAEASMDVAGRLLAWDPTDRLAQRSADISRGQIAIMLKANGRPGEALAIVDQQLAGYRSVAERNPKDGDAQRRVAVPMRMRAEMVAAAHGPAAGCRALREAEAAWLQIEADWGLSDFDRENEIDRIEEALSAGNCP